MHDKYLCHRRQQHAPLARYGRITTGRTLTDVWASVIVLRSQSWQYFTNDFNELWATGTIASTSAWISRGDSLQYGGQPARVSISFAPNDGFKSTTIWPISSSELQERLTICRRGTYFGHHDWSLAEPDEAGHTDR